MQFWLEQNARMLGATIQALEVQRMTLSTLKTMNVQMEDLRESLQIRMPAAARRCPPEPARPRRRTGNGTRARRRAAAALTKPSPTSDAPDAAHAAGSRRPDAMVGRADQAVHRTRRHRDERTGRFEPGLAATPPGRHDLSIRARRPGAPSSRHAAKKAGQPATSGRAPRGPAAPMTTTTPMNDASCTATPRTPMRTWRWRSPRRRSRRSATSPAPPRRRPWAGST